MTAICSLGATTLRKSLLTCISTKSLPKRSHIRTPTSDTTQGVRPTLVTMTLKSFPPPGVSSHSKLSCSRHPLRVHKRLVTATDSRLIRSPIRAIDLPTQSADDGACTASSLIRQIVREFDAAVSNLVNRCCKGEHLAHAYPPQVTCTNHLYVSAPSSAAIRTRMSQISWRTSVAHQPTEDSGCPSVA
jgi:hypothetical protein